MQPTDPRIVIRPRPAWEAIDLGILLAAGHRRLLMLSWALVTLPVLGLLTLLLWDYPGAVALLFWWLKPLYERLPLLILSRALFAAPPTLGQALKDWPATLRSQWLPSLLWRRLSLLRSFTLPVQQLEGLSGDTRQQRLSVLTQADVGAARWLTLAGAHLELVLYVAAIVLIYAFVPRQMDTDWSRLLLLGSDARWLWVDHLLNLVYALILIAWGPIYVACGFMLYLNRRIRLEAWDIEGVFKRLRRRLTSAMATLVIGAGLLLSGTPSTGWAADASPQSPRLTHQALNSQQSRQAINELLTQPPFSNRETVTRWRLPETTSRSTPTPPSARQNQWLPTMTAGALEVLLWSLAIGLSGLAIWRYRQWLRFFVPTPKKKQPGPTPATAPQVGPTMAAPSLPDDIVACAQALWPDSPRDALGLLYRGLLNRLIIDYRLPLTTADTEAQVLQRVATLDEPALSAFSQALTRHWQDLAYGHQTPAPHVLNQLCDGWHRLFEAGDRA